MGCIAELTMPVNIARRPFGTSQSFGIFCCRPSIRSRLMSALKNSQFLRGAAYSVLLSMGLLAAGIVGSTDHGTIGYAEEADKAPAEQIVELREAGTWPNQTSVFLKIPRAFYRHPRAEVAQVKGLNIFAFYPEFSAPSDPRNAPYIYRCAGYCGGRMLVSLKTVGFHWNNANATDLVANDYLKKRATGGREYGKGVSVKMQDQTPEFGFDIAFDQVTFHGEDVTRRHRYMIRRARDGAGYELVADCSVSVLVPACTLHFSSKCAPAMEIEVVAWEYSMMEQALDIWRRADAFITAMVQNDTCHVS